MKDYCETDTPLGRMILVARAQVLVGAYFAGQKYFPASLNGWARNPRNPALLHALREIGEYFGGTRRDFSVTLAPQGTEFQQRVWRALLALPYGETTTYGDLARRLGMLYSARAVGTAIGRNPLAVFVPCHRVLALSGALAGYAGGTQRKRALLALESGNVLSCQRESAERVA